MNKTIYIVTSGEYSDYKIEAVFTDESVADDFAADGPDRQVEEWGVDDYRKRGDRRVGHYVAIARDGSVLDARALPFDGEPTTFDGPCYNPEYFFTDRGLVGLHVWARDEKHAIKIVNEKRTQLIANNEWHGN